MRTLVSVDTDDLARYVIAKYGQHATARATRAQVRDFVRSALVTNVRRQRDGLTRRQQRVAQRLSVRAAEPVAPLQDPAEYQLELFE